jgi:PAS domain S-box-containing protein
MRGHCKHVSSEDHDAPAALGAAGSPAPGAVDQPFQSLLESSDEGIWTVDLAGRCTFANPTCVKRLGCSSESELVGKSMHDLTHHSRADGSRYPREECRIYRAFSEGVVHEVEDEVLWRRDGSFFPVRYRSVPIFSAGEPTGAVVFFEDITERVRQTTGEQRMIGIVSHDLRNPIATVLLAAGFMLRDERLTEDQRRSLGRIQSAAGRAERLVSDLLDVTQARLGGGIPVDPRVIDLHALVRELVDEARAAHPRRQIVHLASEDGWGEWDADRVTQVVTNLVTNALHHSPEGTPVVVETCGGTADLVIHIHNAGPPIPASLLPHVFEPMTTLRAGGAAHGVGLGLYIVHEIVRAHAGSVRVVSSPAIGGTRFTVELPRRNSRLHADAAVEPRGLSPCERRRHGA